MKVYAVIFPFDSQGNPVFRITKYSTSGAKGFRSSYAAKSLIFLEWDDEEGLLPTGDIVRFPILSLCVKRSVAEVLSPLIPPSDWINVKISGVDEFKVLNIQNHENEHELRAHAFIMLETHNHLLVSERLRDLWVSHGFRGALFEEVAEISDSAFTTQTGAAP